MSDQQKTIQKEITLSGIGLHTGNKVTVCFKPALVNAGVRFVRVDLAERPSIKAELSNIIEHAIPRCTSIGKDSAVIHTIEHLMSVLCGLGIDNLIIEINGSEVPALDGSGVDFLKAIKQAGILEQGMQRQYFEIKEPIWVEQNGATILALPNAGFKISYLLDYANTSLGAQYFSVDMEPKIFESDIAPCRTFCLESEEEELRKSGLGKGANYDNTLVVTQKGVKDNKTRFDDEFVRHKILDFIGDIYLLGQPIKAHFFAVKSGHSLNLSLLKKIVELKEKNHLSQSMDFASWDKTKEIDINGIIKILPHRYPFLMVDRIVDFDPGKRAVGIKNVSINEEYFQGHFPTKPIMPGVLMVEAMAQVAGVAILTSQEHQGQLALFMAVDKVKFRKLVFPGDQLIIEAEIMRNRAKIVQVKTQAKVGDEVVVEAEIMLSFTDGKFLS